MTRKQIEHLALDEAIPLAKIYGKYLQVVYRQRLNYHLAINGFEPEPLP